MTTSNRIKNVAVVGAGGNIGTYIVAALLATGKHTITALTRADSRSTLPSGLHAIKHIDYNDASTLVSALRGQDALIISINGRSPQDTQPKLIDAAISAGVQFILPNEWSPDSTNPGLVKDVFVFAEKASIRTKIAAGGKDKTASISVITGFWYEWSLAIPVAYGFDFAEKKVVFFDDGETVTCMSTWPQVGRAVAALMSLPVETEGEDQKCLAALRNTEVYVSSFAISQKEMFDSVLRVTGSKVEDWQIKYELAEERFKAGLEGMKTGDRSAFAKMLYTRVFFKDDSGHYQKTKGLHNDLLGLPMENLDEATAAAVKRSKEVSW